MPWIEKPKKKYKNQSNRVKRQNIYNTTLWKRMRLAKLMETPICEVCALEGKSTLAEHIHHKISFMEADDPVERDRLAFSYENLLSVCEEHHNEIHNGDLRGCKTLEQIKKRLQELGIKTVEDLI